MANVTDIDGARFASATMAEEKAGVSYEDLIAIEDEFEAVETEISGCNHGAAIRRL